MKFALAFGCLLVTAGIASAAKITSFSAVAGSDGSFTETIGSSFDANTGGLINMNVGCHSASLCIGTAAQFSMMGTGLTEITPLTITMDGNVSGGGFGLGILHASVLFLTVPFQMPAGASAQTLVSTTLLPTADGTFSVTGYLSLGLQNGQTLTLPSSLAFTLGSPTKLPESTANPEPGTLGLMGASLAGVVFAVRRRLA